MRCHYDVLELEAGVKSTDEEIRQQYRRLALRFHPDKCIGDEEAAAERFKELRNAYSVLSDPRERKWYTDHRHEILSAASGGHYHHAEATESRGRPVDVFPYFSVSTSSGDRDFFKTFDALFKEINQSEFDADEAEASERTLHEQVPEFGDADSATRDVLTFYAFWSSFSSRLTFAWEDLYNTTEASNRMTRRAMEKENKKAKDKVRSDYSASVRNLALHVKRQDPRVRRALQEEEQKKAASLEKAETRRKQELQRRKEQREACVDEEEVRRREKELKSAFLLADEEEYEQRDLSSVDPLVLEASAGESAAAGPTEVNCILCSKIFTTAAQLAQHEGSKVHRKKALEASRAAARDGKGSICAAEKPVSVELS